MISSSSISISLRNEKQCFSFNPPVIVINSLKHSLMPQIRTASVSVTYGVMPVENNAFQVTEPLQKKRWSVQLNDSTCTCGEFPLYKFPCLHAQVVCEKLKINPLQYVDDSYSVERLYRTYAATFNPVPEVSAWPEASGVPTLFPPVIPPPPTNV